MSSAPKYTKIKWNDFLKKNDFSLLALVRYNLSHVRTKTWFRQLTFVYRVLKHWKPYHNYLNLLKTSKFQPLAELDDVILLKVLRPYELYRYSVVERTQILKEHYDILSEKFDEKAISVIFTDLGYKIASYEPNQNITDNYEIIANYSRTHRREGEFAISIIKKNLAEGETDAVGYRRVFSVAFNFGYIDGKKVIKVNSLQGSDPLLLNPQDDISNVTKLGFGMMPMYLLMNIVFCIAKLVQVEYVLGIRKESHVYYNEHYKSKISPMFKNDYDKHWAEFDSKDFNQDYYVLQELPRKDLSEVASKKSSQYRKRYAFLDGIYLSLEKMIKKVNEGS